MRTQTWFSGCSLELIWLYLLCWTQSTVSCRRKYLWALVLRIGPYSSSSIGYDDPNIDLSRAAPLLNLVTWPLSAVNRKQGIGCVIMRVLKVSGSAVPAETWSPFWAAHHILAWNRGSAARILYLFLNATSSRNQTCTGERAWVGVSVIWTSSFHFININSTAHASLEWIQHRRGFLMQQRAKRKENSRKVSRKV